MAEASFNAKGFTEILAVGSDGGWAHITRSDGGVVPASDAFRVGAAHGYQLRFSNGVTQQSPGNDPWGAKSNHGPFFVDVHFVGRVEAGQWMWCDAEFGGPGRLRMGKVLGTKGACFADEQGGYVWRWYGRSAAPAVVVGTAVQAPPPSKGGEVGSKGVWTEAAVPAMGTRPLVEIVELLKRELGLSGNVHTVITQACAQLGVQTNGKSLYEQAHECCRLVE